MNNYMELKNLICQIEDRQHIHYIVEKSRQLRLSAFFTLSL